MHQRRLVLASGVLTGLFAAGYGVMFTVLDDFRDSYGISGSALGLIVAVGFFASFAAQVLLAPMADRGHARRLVLAGLALDLVGLTLMAVGETVAVLLVARVVMGLGAGCALPAIRRVVVLADPAHLGRNIGKLLAADVAGFAAGPAVSAVLVGPFGIPAPFIAIAVATAICAPVCLRMRVDESIAGDLPSARFAFDLFRIRPFAGAICFGSAVFLMIGTFDALWALVLDDLDTADWIANAGITLFAVPLFLLGSSGGRLAQRVGPFRVGTVGLVLGAAFMVAYGHLPTGMAIFAASILHSLSDGMTVSASGVAVGLAAPKDRQAGAQGMLGGIQTLTGGMSAILGGWLYEHHGRATAYTFAAVAMLVLVGLGLALAGPAWNARPVIEDTPADAPVPI